MNWKNRRACGTLSIKDLHQTVQVAGWVDAIRDHGHILFIHLRDRSGIIQVVFDPAINAIAAEEATKLRSEFCITLTGKVRTRATDTINPNLSTGTLEIAAETLDILSIAKTPPFLISEKDMVGADHTRPQVDEDIRLQYRFLDLRRQSLQQKLIKRSQFTHLIRNFMHTQGFIEVETPVLTKSTPEGARDYLVPSRVQHGKCYALPQSPQLFKQLLMVSGFEKYFQIAKCFRDEDLRPNRQPEFTQLDMELSFIEEEDILTLIETLLTDLFKAAGKPLVTPFPRMSYDDAISYYGSDAPDLRFDLKLVDATDIFKASNYKILKQLYGQKGLIKGINIKGQAEILSKNILQNEWAKDLIPKLGAKGMTWMKFVDGELQSNIVQFFSDTEKAEIKTRFQAENGDVIILIADTNHALVHDVLGRFRRYLGATLNLIDPKKVSPCWVTEFPLFEWKDGQLHSLHHPFTAPKSGTDTVQLTDPKDWVAVKARAYDVVINGEEIGGGSIRIHQTEVQELIFKLLGLSETDIQEKFGFFTNALTYGTPPHGGIALGLDRLYSMLLDTDSIREVIAFPKNRHAVCPMTEAPSAVTEKQLKELGIKPI